MNRSQPLRSSSLLLGIFTIFRCAVGQEVNAIPELVPLKAKYEELVATTVAAPAAAAQKKLDGNYASALENKIISEQNAGRLENVVALKAEHQRIDTGEVASTTEAVSNPALTSLRTTYVAEKQKIDATSAQSLKTIQAPYIERLNALETELTQSNRLPEAISVREYRMSLAPRLQGAGEAAKPAMPTSGESVVVESGSEFSSFDEIIESIPEETQKKLRRSSTRDEGLKECNDHLRQNAINKTVKVTTSPAKVDQSPTDPQKVRINFPVDAVKRNYSGIGAGNMWAYFVAGNPADPADLDPGDEITVEGTISKCEVKIVGSDLQLNLDMQETKVVP